MHFMINPLLTYIVRNKALTTYLEVSLCGNQERLKLTEDLVSNPRSLGAVVGLHRF